MNYLKVDSILAISKNSISVILCGREKFYQLFNNFVSVLLA